MWFFIYYVMQLFRFCILSFKNFILVFYVFEMYHISLFFLFFYIYNWLEQRWEAQRGIEWCILLENDSDWFGRSNLIKINRCQSSSSSPPSRHFCWSRQLDNCSRKVRWQFRLPWEGCDGDGNRGTDVVLLGQQGDLE